MGEDKVYVDLVDGKFVVWLGDGLEVPADAYRVGFKNVALQMATAMADKNHTEVVDRTPSEEEK